jgi:UDP-N-acetylglucosamine 4,6-dehydratase
MRVFATGLAGSLGTALARLHHARGDQVFGCSRDETRAVEWLSQNAHLGTLLMADCAALLYPLHDVRSIARTCDVVYHLAAAKHVDLCEQNPETAYLQNVGRTMNVIQFCDEAGIPLVFVSSDKACLPASVYGATKFLAEKMVLRSGGAVVRLGNLIGSSGSVFAKWAKAAQEGEEIEVTDPSMTRFFIPIEDAARFIATQSLPGKVMFPPMRAARMGDVVDWLRKLTSVAVRTVGTRPGESLHQWIAAPGDMVKSERGRCVLGEGERLLAGWSSELAEPWGPEELLEAAGIGS